MKGRSFNVKSRLKIQSITKTLNFKKIAKTRRQRGYQWEDTLVKRFNKVDNWKAFRLGSPSVALPDICLLYTSPSPRDRTRSRMPSSA